MNRRAFIMLAVLVVVSGAVLAVMGMLWLVRADVAGAATMEQSAQSRCLAWSGLQAVLVRLDAQRDRILDGARPTIDRQLVIYETSDRVGVVRLLPVGPGDERLAAQAGRLDLNHVTTEALAATGLVDPALGSAIIAEREARGGFQSEIDLLGIEGVTPELLYGSLDRVADDWVQVTRAEEPEPASRLARDDQGGRGLMDVFTVYAFEPMLQRNGRLRINLNTPWSDELGRRLDERFGEGAGQAVRALMEGGVKLDTHAQLLAALRTLQVPVERWGEVLDAVTTRSDELVGGRLDINTASYEALLALPGATPQEAAAIVRTREALGEEVMAEVTWPVLQKVLTPERFEAIASRITTRSWCWRVRLVAGEVHSDNPDGPLVSPVAWEAVIDLTGPQARLAYLREITMLPVAAMLLLDTTTGAFEVLPEGLAGGPGSGFSGGEHDASSPNANDAEDGSGLLEGRSRSLLGERDADEPSDEAPETGEDAPRSSPGRPASSPPAPTGPRPVGRYR